MERLTYIARERGRLSISGAPGGYDAYLAAEAAARRKGLVLFVAADDSHAVAAADAMRFFAPDVSVLPFPAWDCLPYDRTSPKPDIESARLATLAALARRDKNSAPVIVVTTVNALLQRVPPKSEIAKASFFARVAQDVQHDALTAFLVKNGYAKASTVREPGDFALRGGIVDLWPPGTETPLRLDFFGATLDAIRTFDAETQLSSGQIDQIELLPASEAPLDAESISRFRTGYVATFGPATSDDNLYESVSAGRKMQGMEHWLPLFHDHLDTLFDYAPDALVMLSHQIEEAKAARLELVKDYYETRRQFLREQRQGEAKVAAPPYKPLSPEKLYLTDGEWNAALSSRDVRELSPFQAPESMRAVDAGGKQGRDFAPERAQGKVNVFQIAADHIGELLKAKKRVLVATWSNGAADRIGGLLSDHGIAAIRQIDNWSDAAKLSENAVGVAVLGLEHGIEAPDFAIVSEQDILGDRMVRNRAGGRSGRRIFCRKRPASRRAILSPISSMASAASPACKPSMSSARRMIAWSCIMTAASCSCRSRTSSF